MVCSAAVAVSTVANGELLLAPSPLLSRSWAPAPPLQLLAVLSLSSLWSRWSPLALPPAPHSHCCPWLRVALNGGRGIIARISMHIAKHSCSIWPLFLIPAVVAAGHGGGAICGSLAGSLAGWRLRESNSDIWPLEAGSVAAPTAAVSHQLMAACFQVL